MSPGFKGFQLEWALRFQGRKQFNPGGNQMFQYSLVLGVVLLSAASVAQAQSTAPAQAQGQQQGPPSQTGTLTFRSLEQSPPTGRYLQEQGEVSTGLVEPIYLGKKNAFSRFDEPRMLNRAAAPQEAEADLALIQVYLAEIQVKRSSAGSSVTAKNAADEGLTLAKARLDLATQRAAAACPTQLTPGMKLSCPQRVSRRYDV